jgi:pimeloyl-ACP methyl ester carboxylesterase
MSEQDSLHPTITMLRLRGCLVALALLSAAQTRSARAQSPSLSTCVVPGLDGDVRCASVAVPENRARPGGRQIRIAVVVARTTGATGEPDPFVLLAGGPGQAGTRMGPFATEAFSLVRERRDLVLIDARGTGNSNGLACPMLRDPSDLAGRTLFPTAAVIHCRDSLAAAADLAQYTTANIADDLEDVRRAFGWPALNLYGTSYGSRLAFVFLRRHPNSVRSVVLKAVAPPTLIAPMNYAADAERAIGLLVRDCAADAGCAKAFPNPRADFDTVLARAATGRLRLAAEQNPEAGALVVSREILASLLMSALQSSGARAQLPLVVHQAALGDTRQLAAFVTQGRRALDRELFYGMHLSVMCGEDGRMIDTSAARRDDGRTFLGSARVRMVVDACANWIVPEATSGAFDAVRAATPVLLVSGELDPNTPPRHAEDALRTLPNGRHVVLRGVAHGWSNVAACGAAFVADFVARASARELDLSCAERSSAPPFVLR